MESSVMATNNKEKNTNFKSGFRSFLRNYGIIFVIIVFCIPVSIMSPIFLTGKNLMNVLLQMTIIGVVAVGETFVITAGGSGIDLSVGSILAFSAVVGADAMVNYGMPWYLAIVIMLAIGTLLGFINGIIVAKLQIAPLIATLAMMTIFRGATLVYTGGADITGVPEQFTSIVTKGIVGLRYAVIIMIVLYIIAAIMLNYTRKGREIFAVGGNEKAAQVSGINPINIRILVYTLCGFCASLAGILLTARLFSAGPRAGDGYEITAISAVVIGGTSLSGGKGSMIGTFLGVVLLSLIDNTTNLLAIPTSYIQLFKGIVIMIAVIIDRIRTVADSKK